MKNLTLQLSSFTYDNITQRMRWIKPGRFMMGSPETEPERFVDETLHEVVLTKGFWLAENACIQELWKAVMGSNPSRFKGKKRPVENISWKDSIAFLDIINSLMPELLLRLPTEAEWEYACRAGTPTPFSFGDNITSEQVNYNREETVDTGSLPCNDWGLYEMHGNVLEWCADWYGEYPPDSVFDPVGPPGGTYRVLRGGSWFGYDGLVRSAIRYNYEPDTRDGLIGFRFAQDPKWREKSGRSKRVFD